MTRWLKSRWAAIPLLVALSALPMLAQGVRYDNVAQANVAGVVRVIPNAPITVCTSTGTGIPCSPTTPIFSDIGLTVPITQPGFTADANGNFGFYVSPTNKFTYSIGASALAPGGALYVVTPQCPLAGACTFSGTLALSSVTSMTSASANPAGSGVIRLASGDIISWRNNANNGDVPFQKNGAAGANLPSDTLCWGSACTGGIVAGAFINSTANPSVTGSVRLSSGNSVSWRNNANNADLAVGTNSSDQLVWPNTLVVGGAFLDSGVTTAVLTGTGACGTFSGQVGGQFAGSASCTSATAASTLTIGSLPNAAHGYVCSVQDETTRANVFQQTSHNTTSCTLTVTSVTQNDVFVFTAIGF